MTMISWITSSTVMDMPPETTLSGKHANPIKYVGCIPSLRSQGFRGRCRSSGHSSKTNRDAIKFDSETNNLSYVKL